MKAQLEFILPDDKVDFRNAVDANAAFSLICDLKDAIRARVKYQDPAEDEKTFLEQIRQLIYDEFPDIDER